MDALTELVGDSPALVGVRTQVTRLLQRHRTTARLPPILIQGETGTGKGLLARLLHRESPRGSAPFVDVNCAAIPEALLEAEMFGYERGAFTDARQAKPGLFRAAHGGTIFLDEVALLPHGLQAKLLKAIEEQAVRRLGSTRTEPVDAWVLAATNTDLAAAVRQGGFRGDLYHRLAVVTFTLPPLRERAGDVLVLAEQFLARACADYRLPPKTLAADARAALLAYPWPGNVRELANVLERVALLSDTTTITGDMLGLKADSPTEGSVTGASPGGHRTLDAMVRDHLERVLEEHGWNISRAALALGVARNTLRARIAKHGLVLSSSPRHGPTRARGTAAPSGGPAASAMSGTAGSAPTAPANWESRRLAFLRAAMPMASDETGASLTYGAIDAVAGKVGAFAGQVIERSPEGLVAVFGLDLMEDPVGRAASAALAIGRLAERAGAGIRLGLHVGRCLVAAVRGRHEIDLDGKQSAWASLDGVLAGVGPGEVRASADTLPFLRGRFDLEAGGTADAAPAPVWVRGRASPDLRSRTPFVGREAELAFLKDRLAAARTGHGQMVGLVGEPGAGKSRLVAEFRAVVRREGLVYVEGACVPHGSAIPYLPMIDLLRGACGIGAGDAPDVMTEKVRTTLRLLRLDADETAAYLLPLLGLGEDPAPALAPDTVSPQARRGRTIAILREIALAASRRGSVVLVVEDIQWIDQTSEACLAALTDSLAGAPILALTTYRASYRPTWLERSYATQVALSALSTAQSSGLVRSLLPASAPDDVVRALVDRGDGNPFFLEELARAQRDDPSGQPTSVLPETVQEVLQLRIDRLPAGARRALLVAAVIGRRVPRWLLEAIWPGPDNLDSSLRTLVALEFLYERGGGEPAYAFRHALTHEVAYANPSASERQALHGVAAEALEERHRARLDPVLEHLARHYALSPRPDKAVHYLARFAEKAARTHAHTEAIGALDQALARVEELPEPERAPRRADLLLRRVASLLPLGRFQEAHDRLVAPALQSVAPTEAALAGPYHYLRARVASFLGAHDEATESAERAIEAGRRAGDVRMMGKAHAFLALDAALVGLGQAGLAHGRQALVLLEGTAEQGWLGVAHWAMGLGQAATGEFARALDAEARARTIATAIGDRALLASVAWATGAIHAAAGDGAAAIRACTESLAQAPDPLQAALARGWLGYAYVELGDPAAAIPLLEQSTRELATFRFARHGWFRVFLAEAYRQSGRLYEASMSAKDGLAAMTAPRLAYGTGWGHRVLGRVAQAERAYEAAEAHFLAAHRTFDAIAARYELARTELDLAALAEARGDPGHAAACRAAAQSRLNDLGIRRDPELADAPLGQRPQDLTATRREASQAGDAGAKPLPGPPQGETP